MDTTRNTVGQARRQGQVWAGFVLAGLLLVLAHQAQAAGCTTYVQANSQGSCSARCPTNTTRDGGCNGTLDTGRPKCQAQSGIQNLACTGITNGCKVTGKNATAYAKWIMVQFYCEWNNANSLSIQDLDAELEQYDPDAEAEPDEEPPVKAPGRR